MVCQHETRIIFLRLMARPLQKPFGCLRRCSHPLYFLLHSSFREEAFSYL